MDTTSSDPYREQDHRLGRSVLAISIYVNVALVAVCVCLLTIGPRPFANPASHVSEANDWMETPVDVSPDGSRFVYLKRYLVNRQGSMSIYIGDTRENHPPWKLADFDFPYTHNFVSWSPTGSQIAVASHAGHVEIWDVDTKSRVWSVRAGKKSRSIWGEMAFSGSRLIILSGDELAPGARGRLRVFDSKTGAILLTDDDFEDLQKYIAVPANSEVAYTGALYGGMITVVNLSDGSHRRSFGWRTGITGNARDPGLAGIAISDDGMLLVAAGEGGGYSIWDVKDDRLLHEEEGNRILQLRFVPGTHDLLTTVLDGQKRLHLIRWRVEEGGLRETRNYGDFVPFFKISADASRVIAPSTHWLSTLDLLEQK